MIRYLSGMNSIDLQSNCLNKIAVTALWKLLVKNGWKLVLVLVGWTKTATIAIAIISPTERFGKMVSFPSKVCIVVRALNRKDNKAAGLRRRKSS
jgi:hypothetical protein